MSDSLFDIDRSVAAGVLAGESLAQIAAESGLSENEVRARLVCILRRLQDHNAATNKG